MAQALSSAAIGDNSVSQAAYLDFIDRYSDCDNECRQAVARRNRLRAEIKSVGIPLASFDRARKDMEKSGTLRESEDSWYRRMMGWLKKPVGFQASMDLASTDPNELAFNVHELKVIDTQGLEAGKAGHKRDANPYTPGTEGYQRFDTAWMRGQEEIAMSMAPPNGAAANGGAAPAADGGEGKRRGRPKGSKNRPKAGDAIVGGAGTGDEPGPDAALH